MASNIDYGTDDFWKIIPLALFRRTPNVDFHTVKMEDLEGLGGMDHVKHGPNGKSPGYVDVKGEKIEGWYHHPHQQVRTTCYCAMVSCLMTYAIVFTSII